MARKANYNYAVYYILTIAIVMGATACRPSKEPKLIIATAANAQYAIQKIADEFTHETGIATELIISSSGKHTAQIEAGAPYDIFISADMKYPKTLAAKNLTEEAPRIYAYGKLALWTVHNDVSPGIGSISDKAIAHVAMPSAKTAPYGKAASEALDHYGIYKQISHKLVFGASVAQTNQFILSGAADLGFTAASVVMAPAMRNKGRWQLIDAAAYSPIAQGAVVLKNSSYPAQAKLFYTYLYSSGAQKILQEYGYAIEEPS